MSLLIDALKNAEAARKKSGAKTAHEPPALELEPTEPAASPAPSTQRSATDRTALQTEEAIPPSTQPGPLRTTSAQRENSPSIQQREALRTMLQTRGAPQRSTLLMAFFGSTLLVLLLGGLYVWQTIEQTQRPALNLPPTIAQGAVQSPTPEHPPAPPITSPQQTLPLAAPPAHPADRRPSPPAQSRSNGPIMEQRPVAAPSLAHPPDNPAPPASAHPSVPTLSPADTAVVTHHDSAHLSNTAAREAYDTYLAGDLEVARMRYRAVLRQDPKNTEALDALGMIALREGNAEQAARLFRRALQLNPKDAFAYSQLNLLASPPDSLSESHAKVLLAEQPGSASAHFALGSLYAREQRWREAQEAFFQALSIDGENPDTLYNLAVCLEHLHQPRLAHQYYDQAVQAARRQPAAFDLLVAISRAKQLEQE